MDLHVGGELVAEMPTMLEMSKRHEGHVTRRIAKYNSALAQRSQVLPLTYFVMFMLTLFSPKK